MSSEVQPTEQPTVQHVHRSGPQGGSAGAVYGLGLIGAWIYYIGRAGSFQEGAIGFLKGFVWPVFVVYGLLAFLDKKE